MHTKLKFRSNEMSSGGVGGPEKGNDIHSDESATSLEHLSSLWQDQISFLSVSYELVIDFLCPFRD